MDPDTYKVSVIIPCFNHGKYLDAAVSSALGQTCQDLEVIIVDDGSTEPETVALLSHYDRPRTTVVRIPNQGPAVARAAGISRAKGKYILPLDADDWIDADYAELAADILDSRPEIGIVYCDAELVYPDSKVKWGLPPYSFPEILLGNMIVSTAMYRKADYIRAGGYNPSMYEGWEDFDLWLSLIENGLGVYKLNRTLFHYNISRGRRSSTLDLAAEERLFTLLYRQHTDLYVQNIGFVLKTAEARKLEIAALRQENLQVRAQLDEILNSKWYAAVQKIRKHRYLLSLLRGLFSVVRMFRRRLTLGLRGGAKTG